MWETDLGEFIIQLAGEPPSHIIGPAVHKNKAQIADLFAEKLGVPRVETPKELTRIAREKLREKFVHADMGITGANAAVAETGSIVLLENEGNIRLSTTIPRIHVALMGIEKVIPTLDDLATLLALLPRSATGQKLSSYTTIITGPRRPGEADGPEEFHLILLDNGRSRILADPDRRECLYCVRCGCCLNTCPVYRKAGGHSYGWVYSGPIGAVLTPQLIPARLARDLPFASTLCGACGDVCPVKIPLPKLLLTMRQRITEDPNWDGGISPLQKPSREAPRLAPHPPPALSSRRQSCDVDNPSPGAFRRMGMAPLPPGPLGPEAARSHAEAILRGSLVHTAPRASKGRYPNMSTSEREKNPLFGGDGPGIPAQRRRSPRSERPPRSTPVAELPGPVGHGAEGAGGALRPFPSSQRCGRSSVRHPIRFGGSTLFSGQSTGNIRFLRP